MLVIKNGRNRGQQKSNKIKKADLNLNTNFIRRTGKSINRIKYPDEKEYIRKKMWNHRQF
ncbi:hypothetical protein TOT_010000479 [Theileria orientalis strain Shintoku]|uniref:Uncharacterized protein n=1 Tax=Theileria orientalis strain Shintoku TaxID=869250 RepID=J4DNI4_THEOR|nr:hypothetical protein TOT_010000479 [Theileria orientalis strain Shintoku]PVC50104.1 hypothetical protein MACL_00002528 [Theileria orientalis]BAM39014.1 hypothetical protein TOT_010000479 [Theileria orientalis strain Shintoku]|eukprot:XP_009689315.1 hypothetical protein TOT_010000479 [Theileria orientalis strain Shintoku]